MNENFERKQTVMVEGTKIGFPFTFINFIHHGANRCDVVVTVKKEEF